MSTESTPSAAIAAVRSSHDRLAGLLTTLPEAEHTRQSYDDDWSVAQVASHLGSQAQIFELFLDAGADGLEPPAIEQFRAIWSHWDAMEPAEQVRSSLEADEHLVERLEGLGDGEHDLSVDMFGERRDVAGIAGLRLGEHALHTWDIAVALDPSATVSPEAVELLVDTLPTLAGRAGRPSATPATVRVSAAGPDHTFVVTTGPDVSIGPGSGDEPADVLLPTEALVRLVYGRLDEDHTPADVVGAEHLVALREVFPGF
ncbi:MAG: hypothetical protein JWP82_3212 [Humibacillus sp.]|nr:hypothetical protein [Humibacillus sp.]